MRSPQAAAADTSASPAPGAVDNPSATVRVDVGSRKSAGKLGPRNGSCPSSLSQSVDFPGIKNDCRHQKSSARARFRASFPAEGGTTNAVPELRSACSRPTPLGKKPAKARTTSAGTNDPGIACVLLGIKRAETIQPRLNTRRVHLFFDNLTGPRPSEPGAISNARRRPAQVGVRAGGCAETVARGSRASTHRTPRQRSRTPPRALVAINYFYDTALK